MILDDYLHRWVGEDSRIIMVIHKCNHHFLAVLTGVEDLRDVEPVVLIEFPDILLINLLIVLSLK